jgi:hypothetical protein
LGNRVLHTSVTAFHRWEFTPTPDLLLRPGAYQVAEGQAAATVVRGDIA